jgi:hypothetical protein
MAKILVGIQGRHLPLVLTARLPEVQQEVWVPHQEDMVVVVISIYRVPVLWLPQKTFIVVVQLQQSEDHPIGVAAHPMGLEAVV